jgi:hypothetical protein
MTAVRLHLAAVGIILSIPAVAAARTHADTASG